LTITASPACGIPTYDPFEAAEPSGDTRITCQRCARGLYHAPSESARKDASRPPHTTNADPVHTDAAPARAAIGAVGSACHRASSAVGIDVPVVGGTVDDGETMIDC